MSPSLLKNHSIATLLKFVNMITLNKLAQSCLFTIMKRFRLNKTSSIKAFGNYISACWRKMDMLDTTNEELLQEREKRAADIIIATVAYLEMLGCEDIEKLIKDRIKEFE